MWRMWEQTCRGKRTDNVAVLIFMLHLAERAQIGLLQGDAICQASVNIMIKGAM